MTPCEFHLMHYVVIFCSRTAEGILLFLLYYFEIEKSNYNETCLKRPPYGILLCLVELI